MLRLADLVEKENKGAKCDGGGAAKRCHEELRTTLKLRGGGKRGGYDGCCSG